MPTAVEAHPNFKFMVEIDNQALGAFTECTLPALQVDVDKVNEGGLNDYVHQLPKGIQAGSITLKHGLVKAQNDAMMNWYFLVLRGQVKDAMKSVTVVMLGEDNTPVMNFHFENCYPIKWQGPSLNAGQGAVAIEEVQLAYHSVSID